MTINQAMTLARKMMKPHKELTSWKVTFNNRKRSFGVCSYRDRQIELSAHLVPVMTEEAIKKTIIHEIAHALTPGHHHDGVWRAKCIELGGDGERCGSHNHYKDGMNGQKEFQKKTAKYTLTCPECGNTSFMNRRPSKSYSCGKHGRSYNPKYKLIVKQNY